MSFQVEDASKTNLGEYIPLQNTYDSMNSQPRALMSVASTDDLNEDDHDDRSDHTSDQNTSTTDVSLESDLLDLARDGEARRLKIFLGETLVMYCCSSGDLHTNPSCPLEILLTSFGILKISDKRSAVA